MNFNEFRRVIAPQTKAQDYSPELREELEARYASLDAGKGLTTDELRAQVQALIDQEHEAEARRGHLGT